MARVIFAGDGEEELRWTGRTVSNRFPPLSPSLFPHLSLSLIPFTLQQLGKKGYDGALLEHWRRTGDRPSPGGEAATASLFCGWPGGEMQSIPFLLFVMVLSLIWSQDVSYRLFVSDLGPPYSPRCYFSTYGSTG
jgi:hypothetical protein